jgi:hypothetical protein
VTPPFLALELVTLRHLLNKTNHPVDHLLNNSELASHPIHQLIRRLADSR